MTDFADLLLTFKANVMPEMLVDLAKSLNIPAEAFAGSDIGYYPKEQAWIIPEFDANGNVIGLLKRTSSGKYAWPGSKRGYNYDPMAIRAKDSDVPEDRPHFIRVSERDGICCPLCGKSDWCMVSSDNPQDPAAVICGRTPDGATRKIEGAGYLHHRHPQPDIGRRNPTGVLSPGDPVVVTEGWSDRMYAKSLGYVAVSLPSAGAASKGLCGLVQGRHVILVGDRDPHEVGQQGMEATYQTLKPVVQSIVKVLPPEGKGKDLRASQVTREEFEAHVAKAGVTVDDGSVLQDTTPLGLVKSWLQKRHIKDGDRLLHYINGDYYRWDGNVYHKMPAEGIKCEWYQFFAEAKGQQQTKDGVKIISFVANRKFIGDINDAASSYLNVHVEDGVHEPFSIKARASMDLARAVIFKNGILYVRDDRLAPLTPDVFVTSTLPYEYHPGRTCPLWLWFVNSIFAGDQECIDLLQEWFGYNLIASNHMQSMMFFFGVPGSGKSTTAGILEALLGRVRCCGASTNNFRTLFGKESLLNKYAAIMSESRDTAKRDIDQLLQTWKALTGGDLMNVARKYKAAVDVSLFCRLTYVANEAIPFDDASQAMASRMNLLYFPNNYRRHNPDRELLHKLREELPGVALWSIEGLKRLLANNRFTLPQQSKVQLAKIADLTNPVGAMMEECVERFIGAGYANHRVPVNDLYDLWKNWCEVNMSRTSLSQIGFGMKLAHMANPIKSKRIMEAGRRSNVYPGIAIRPEAAERYLKR